MALPHSLSPVAQWTPANPPTGPAGYQDPRERSHMREAAHDPTIAIFQSGYPQNNLGRHDVFGVSEVQSIGHLPSNSRHLPIEETSWHHSVGNHNGRLRALSDPRGAFPFTTHRQHDIYGFSNPTIHSIASYPQRSARPPGEQRAPLKKKATSWEEFDSDEARLAPPDQFVAKRQARATGRLFSNHTEDSEILLDSGAGISLIHPSLITYHNEWWRAFSCEPIISCGLHGGRAILDIQVDLSIYVDTTDGDLQNIEVRAYVLPWLDPRTHLTLIGATDLVGNEIHLLFTGDQARKKGFMGPDCYFPIDLEV